MFKTIRNLRLFTGYLKDPEVSIWKKILMFLPLAYFILPFDVFPDILFPFGYLDDAGLVVFAWQMIMGELEKYQATKAPKSPKGDKAKVVHLNRDDYKVK